jgi:hypothetical protein
MNNENRLRTRCLLAFIMAVVLGYGSLATAAEPADIITAEFPAGTACSFDLNIEIWGGTQHFQEFKDKAGNIVRTLVAGKGSTLRFINTSTTKSFSTKSNGSVSRRIYNPDGSYTETDTGHNVLILFPTDNPPGPSTTLIVGSLVFTVDLDGVFSVQNISGTETDICDALS